MSIVFCAICIFIFCFMAVKIYKKQKMVEQHMLNMIIVSKVYLICAIVVTLIMIAISIFPINITRRGKIVLFIVLILLLAFIYLFSFLFSCWYIDIKEETIEYCSLFGKIQFLSYKSIKNVEVDENNILHIHFKDEKKLKLSAQSKFGQNLIINELRHHNISVIYKYSINSFVMKLPLLYPVMHICCAIISSVFTIACGKMDMLIGIVLGILLMISSVCAFMSDIIGRVVINKNIIYQYRFLRRVKQLNISEIIRVDRREKDNAQYVLFYSKSGLKMKINMLCKNANLLEQIIRQHRWE